MKNPGDKEGPDWFKRTIDVTTLFIIVAGLFVGVDQAKKLTESIANSNRSNNLSTWSTITTQGQELDKVLVEHPEFQKYFFDGIHIETNDPIFDRANAISLMFLDYIDSVLAFLSYTENEEPRHLPAKGSHSSGRKTQETFIERDTWKHYFDSLFRSSPLLCRTLVSNQGFYGREVLKIGLPACSINNNLKGLALPQSKR